MRTISIRQPWAWAIVAGHKPVENRSWATSYRGPVLIHAGKTASKRYMAERAAEIAEKFGLSVPAIGDLPLGGIVGIADLVDCLPTHPSPWYIQGEFAWVLANARPLPFLPCKGQLGFFDVPAFAMGLELSHNLLEKSHA